PGRSDQRANGACQQLPLRLLLPQPYRHGERGEGGAPAAQKGREDVQHRTTGYRLQTPMNQHHNRLYGKALYMEVRDLIMENGPLTNLQVRDHLAKAHGVDVSSNLEGRVRKATEQLYRDGYLDRSQEVSYNKTIRYLYFTPQPTSAC